MAENQNTDNTISTKTNNKNNNVVFLFVAALIIIGIIYLLFFYNYNNNKIKTITSQYSLNLNSSSFLFTLNNSEYSLYLYSVSKNKADVYLQRFPNFVNPVLNVSIYLNNSTKLNLGSKYADLEIKLNSISSNSVNIDLIPLQQYLLIKPDSENINIVKTYSQNNTALFNKSINKTPSVTTTLQNTTTSVISTTVPSSSNITTASANKAVAIKLVKSDKYYALLQNYSDIYSNAANNCTSSLYNSTYLNEYAKQPAGPLLYKNIKNNSPSNIVSNISNKNNEFYFTYIAESPNSSIAGNILTLTVNVSSISISNSTFSGIFKEQNYTSIYSNYLTITKITNSCAAYVI